MHGSYILYFPIAQFLQDSDKPDSRYTEMEVKLVHPKSVLPEFIQLESVQPEFTQPESELVRPNQPRGLKKVSRFVGRLFRRNVTTPEAVPCGAEPHAICIVRCNYSGQTEGEVSFKEGELIYIINHGKQSSWWFARSKESGKEGYIPSNCVEEWLDEEK